MREVEGKVSSMARLAVEPAIACRHSKQRLLPTEKWKSDTQGRGRSRIVEECHQSELDKTLGLNQPERRLGHMGCLPSQSPQ